MKNELADLFGEILLIKALEQEKQWFQSQRSKLVDNYSERALFIAFGSASRQFKPIDLHLSEKEISVAEQLGNGVQISHWNQLQLLRTILLLHIPTQSEENYVSTLNKLFNTADVAEQVAMYQALPVLPHPSLLVARAAEGVRTNMTVVLDAIALQNPFPKTHFDQIAWNQMVLKSVFTERPLYKIIGLDERANPALTHMLLDYAHERQAAGRYIVPELWRAALPFLNESYLTELEKPLGSADDYDVAAAALCLKQIEGATAQEMIKKNSKRLEQALKKYPDWETLGQKYAQKEAGSGYQQAGSGKSQTP